jgi:hypothetical protein
MPQPHCESWLMETKLRPYVHYVPINKDMSNDKEMVKWAEANLEQTLLISNQSTLFIHDLLFHPDAIRDEALIKEKIMKRYKEYFS